MAKIFDETTINGMVLKNRLVRSATWEGMCEADGRPTHKLIECYKDLAAGGVGLIVTGYTFVRKDGVQLPGKMGIHVDDFANDMKKMTKRVHKEGGRICLQLVHVGGQIYCADENNKAIAPSGLKVDQFPDTPKEMTGADIDEIVVAFADGAQRAKQYGFDAVQLHSAHGFLINQFLSPLTNRRQDEYGGTIENRSRFLMEIYAKVRAVCGSSYPVMVKLNGSDFVEGGLEISDAVFVAKALDRVGIDAIEVSGGTPASGEKSPVRTKIDSLEKEAYNLALAKEIRTSVNCPVMVVGGFRSPEIISEVLASGAADFVSLSRPFIREPDLVMRWKQGDKSPAHCISCNGCFEPGLKEGGIYCVIAKKKKERELA